MTPTQQRFSKSPITPGTRWRFLKRGARLVGASAACALLGLSSSWAQSGTPVPSCNPNKLYDIISSSFHQSVAQLASDRGWAGWGQNMGGGSDVAPPRAIMGSTSVGGTNIGNAFPGVAPLLITSGSATTSHQTIALGNDGKIYAWGVQGIVIPTTYTTSTAVQATSLGLPAGVGAGDVTMLFATHHTLALVANGNVWILTNETSGSNALLGSGPGATLDGTWHKVKTNATTDLANVEAVRGQVGPGGTGALMALTSNGDVYTWGSNVYDGDGNGRPSVAGARLAKDYATPMVLPTAATPGAKIKQIGLTGGGTAGTTPTATNLNNAYYVLFDSGELFSLGANTYGQLGNGTTTWRTTWGAVLKPANPDGTGATAPFADVKMFSVQEHDWGYAGSGSVGAIDSNGDLYTWGSDDGNMIGQNGGGSKSTPTVMGDLLALKGSGNIKARYVEVGGHTTVYMPQNSPQFCYVGHLTNGSMGNNTTGTGNPWQFNCDLTPAVNICGADSIGATDDVLASVPVPDALTELTNVGVPNVYENDQWRGVPADQHIEDPGAPVNPGMFGKVLTPAAPINWGPVPYLDTSTGKVYAPAGTPPGDYTIRYEICDVDFQTEICAAADIKVTILGIKAIPDTDTTTPGSPVTTKVTDNDQSPSGVPIDPDSVKSLGQPPHGSVVCRGDAGGAGLNPGECKYTPDPGFKGTDTYTYEVCNAAIPVECDTTTVTVAVGEPPAIAAYPDSGVTNVGVALTTSVLANDQAVGGGLDPASVKLKGVAPAGTTVTCSGGTCTFTPTAPGTYTYAYEVCLQAPNTSVCDESTVTVTVPSGGAGTPGISASPDFATTPKNTDVVTPVLYNDSAINGTLDPGSVSVTVNPGHGTTTVDPATGKITYHPGVDFVGTDIYTYMVCLIAPNTTCAPTTVTVKVGDPAISAKDDTATVVGVDPVTVSVIANDTAEGGEIDPASVTVISGPTKGGATCDNTGKCTYTPGGGYDGSDEFTYQVCLKNPKEACSTAKVTVGESKADLYTAIDVPATAKADDVVTALITFGNQGNIPGAVQGDKYKVAGLPTGMAGVTCVGAGCVYDPVTGTVLVTGLPDTLGPGQQQQVRLQWQVPSDAAANSTITLTSTIVPTLVSDPTPNNTASKTLTVKDAGAPASSIAEVTTAVNVPATTTPGANVTGTVSFVNLGSVDATSATYKVKITGAQGVPGVSHNGAPCTVAIDGSLSNCGLPAILPAGQSVDVQVVYQAPADPDDTATVTSTVGASNDDNPANNTAAGTTRVVAAGAANADVTTTVAPPATAVAGTTVNVPVTFSNIGQIPATGVTYDLTLPTGLTGVSCAAPATCNYDIGTGVVSIIDLPPTLQPGEEKTLQLSYTAPLAGNVPGGRVSVTSHVDAGNEDAADNANNNATADTRILNPGVLDIVKTVYEGWNAGASCGTAAAVNQLTIVEKNPTNHNVTWCFSVKNNGTEYLGTPVWNDNAYPGMAPTATAATPLPLAPGATGLWYFQATESRSVVNVVSVEMPVTDIGGNPIIGVPPASNSADGKATFGMIYDPPYGVKVGTTAGGGNLINWTMVWVNDNVVAANNVLVSDVVNPPMSFVPGTLSCVPEGATTVIAGTCNYDAATRTVSVRANFGPDFGNTVANAHNRLFIAFLVAIPAAQGTQHYANQGNASWTPPGGPPLTGVTGYIPGLVIGPIDPANPLVPTVTPPAGTLPGDPGLGHPDPASPPPVATPVDIAAGVVGPGSDVAPIPVDNPIALLLLAVAIVGFGAERHRRAKRH